jgi:hypothetical protein
LKSNSPVEVLEADYLARRDLILITA